jgi:hypothetical protein
MLNVLDEFTHECLAIRVARKLKAIGDVASKFKELARRLIPSATA